MASDIAVGASDALEVGGAGGGSEGNGGDGELEDHDVR